MAPGTTAPLGSVTDTREWLQERISGRAAVTVEQSRPLEGPQRASNIRTSDARRNEHDILQHFRQDAPESYQYYRLVQ